MQVSVLSDLHIDFHISQRDHNRITDKVVYDKFREYLDESINVEVLIVAGDIGHYNKQSQKVLQIIGRIFNYKKIFCVLGNHDLYKSSNHSTMNRMSDWWSFEDPDGVIEVLNCNVVEYKGIRFGGAMGWYDASYLKHLNFDGNVMWLWEGMNDQRYIDGLHNFMDMFDVEYEKLLDIHQSCDVMLSHVNPSSKMEHSCVEYRHSPMTAFFAFDGESLLEATTASYWFYGHTHGQEYYTEHGVECIMNTMGYPKEEAKRLTITLEV